MQRYQKELLERKMPGPREQVMFLSGIWMDNKKTQMLVGGAALVAAATGGYFYAKR